MDAAGVVGELTTAAERLGVRVRCERLPARSSGGRCRVGERELFFIDAGLGQRDRAALLADLLAELDCPLDALSLEGRELVERARRRRRAHGRAKAPAPTVIRLERPKPGLRRALPRDGSGD